MRALADLARFPGVRWLVSAGSAEPWQSTPCLFVLSTGRTGSSTLIHLLNLSPRICGFHEPKPILLHVHRSAFAEAHLAPDRYRKLFARARRRLIGGAGRRNRIYAEATILKFLAPVMARMLPESRFLHLHRHPGEVVRSGMRRGWFQNHGLDPYRIEPLPGDPAHEHWDRWDAFAKVCWTWHVENDYFLQLTDAIGTDRVLSLAFHQWTDHGTGAYRRIFEFAGVEPPDAASVADVLRIRHNMQPDGDFPSYDRWPDDRRQTLLDVAGSTMSKLGYAP